MSIDQFVDEVDKLAPPWNGRSSIERYLKAFDESGELRPLFRIKLHERAVHYLAQREWIETPISLDPQERENYEQLWNAIQTAGDADDDPEALANLESPSGDLQPFVVPATADETVRWQDYEVQVAEINGRPIIRSAMLTFYGEWQRLRFWSLIERYSFHAFLDPRQPLDQVRTRERELDLKGRAMTWMYGHGRLFVLAKEVERDGWYDRLYRATDVIEWGQHRVYDPRLSRWKEGMAMSAEERAASETQRVRERCRALADPWINRGGEYETHVRALLEAWYLASELSAKRLMQCIEQDLAKAVSWAAFALAQTYEDLSAAVGSPTITRGVTLRSVLEPIQDQAKRQAEFSIREFIPIFNSVISSIKLDQNDGERFLAWLAENELISWMLEFSGWVGEFQDPTDAVLDKRFLHIRSLALLHQAILERLADRYGTDEDRRKANSRKFMDPMKAFFSDRPDWRRLVWQHVRENYELTDSSDGRSVYDRLDGIDGLPLDADIGGAAKLILALAAIRNFGSHRFTRETDDMRAHRVQMVRAVVLTPMLYWKVATTLG